MDKEQKIKEILHELIIESDGGVDLSQDLNKQDKNIYNEMLLKYTYMIMELYL